MASDFSVTLKIKRSIEIAIFGWMEIVLGATLGLFFFWWAMQFFINLEIYIKCWQNIDLRKAEGVAMEIINFCCINTLPFALMLPLGIGILKRNNLARRANLFIIVPLLVVSGTLSLRELMWWVESLFGPRINYQLASWSWYDLLGYLMVARALFFFVFSGVIILFFTHPRVKEQFK